MKKWTALVSAFVMLAAAMPVSAETGIGDAVQRGISLDETTFPDAVFREYLREKFDDNGDGFLEDSEIWIVRLDLYNVEGITTLKGIEFLENLWYLNAANCQITEIDVSKNTKLENLCVNDTLLTEIDVSQNPNLIRLEVGWTQISEVDLSKNSLLEIFCCTDSQITTVDVANNPALRILSCGQNAITSLDLSKNPMLEELDIYACSIPELDLSHNPALKNFSARESGLTKIDLSGCPLLESADLLYNEIPEIDVTACTELRSLHIDRNPVSSIDVTNCPKLEALSVQQIDAITEIDVTKNPNLKSLQISGDKITELDITQNPLLKTLDVGCSITKLDVTDKPNLTRLDCRGSSLLTELDVSRNTLLESLYLDFCTGITALDLSNTPLLETLWCKGLPMGYINLENQTLLTDFRAPKSIGIQPGIIGETLDLSGIMPENFDPSRMVSIGNAVLEGSVLTVLDPTEEITYEYDSGYSGETLSFSIAIGTVTCTSELAEPIAEQMYTGQPIQPEITIVCGEKVIEPEYYTVEYQNNTEAGTASAVVAMTNTQKYQGEFTIPFEILKAVPEYEVPTGLTGMRSSTLEDIRLPEGFAWETPEMLLEEAGTLTVTVTYTPEDTVNYKTVTGIEVEVTVKEPERGDINGDGAADLADASLVLTYYAQNAAGNDYTFSENAEEQEAMFLRGDVDEDGILTIQDASFILKYYAQKAAGVEPAWEDIIV